MLKMFGDPIPLNEVSQHDKYNEAGIYMIFCHGNDEHPISIGESQNVIQRLSNHEKKIEWEKECGKKLMVRISVMVTELFSDDERKNSEAKLIKQYKPPYNKIL